MTADLVAFLRTQIAEDRRLAEAVRPTFPSPWTSTSDDYLQDANGRDLLFTETAGAAFVRGGAAPHVARWDPARVLAECDAKEALISLCHAAIWGAEPGDLTSPMLAEDLLRQMARPFADRPGFDDEWRTT